MLVAAALVWTLTMHGIAGKGEFGPYQTLDACQKAARNYFVIQDKSNWHNAVCRNSSGYGVPVGNEKAKR